MIEGRLTAIVQLTYSAMEQMSLDRDREYDTMVEVGGKVVPCKRFKSPIGDERWRETVRTIRRSFHPTGDPSPGSALTTSISATKTADCR